MEKNQRIDTLLIELHYLPCIDYVVGLLTANVIRIEAAEHYQKQSYRNRCYVRTANNVDCLTVPVLNGTHKQPIGTVRIDNSQPWPERHWRCLQAAYAKAPFFEHYAPVLEPVYRQRWTYLFELNQHLLTICLQLLRAMRPVHLTEWYERSPAPGVFDARNRIRAQNRTYSPVFARPVPYAQNFGQEFVPNLSIIDLLFCQGPEAASYLIPNRADNRASDPQGG